MAFGRLHEDAASAMYRSVPVESGGDYKSHPIRKPVMHPSYLSKPVKHQELSMYNPAIDNSQSSMHRLITNASPSFMRTLLDKNQLFVLEVREVLKPLRRAG